MHSRNMALAAFGVISLWVAAIFVIPRFYGRPDGPGTFGDMFGAVNALFSGLAFVVLIFTLVLQSQELRLQREELESTRRELQGQKEQLALQNQTLKKQTFENTFFQLLRLHQEMVASLDIRGASADASATVLGRDCFVRYYKAFRRHFQKTVESRQITNPTLLIEKAYTAFYEEYQTDLGHYFRNLYNLVKFVHLGEIPDDQKRLYTNLVRAQLSGQELLVLFGPSGISVGKGSILHRRSRWRS